MRTAAPREATTSCPCNTGSDDVCCIEDTRSLCNECFCSHNDSDGWYCGSYDDGSKIKGGLEYLQVFFIITLSTLLLALFCIFYRDHKYVNWDDIREAGCCKIDHSGNAKENSSAKDMEHTNTHETMERGEDSAAEYQEDDKDQAVSVGGVGLVEKTFPTSPVTPTAPVQEKSSPSQPPPRSRITLKKLEIMTDNAQEESAMPTTGNGSRTARDPSIINVKITNKAEGGDNDKTKASSNKTQDGSQQREPRDPSVLMANYRPPSPEPPISNKDKQVPKRGQLEP